MNTFIITRALAWLIRIWFGTVRVEIINRHIFDDYFLKSGRIDNVVAASWHRHAAFIVYYFKRLRNTGIMASRSKDGEIAAGMAESLGHYVARGSSSRGGREALAEMIDFMAGPQPAICGTAVDGPRGPARQLKKGMMVLASRTDAFFVPMACSGTRVITFPKSWDKTIIPKPFSKIILIFGQPVKITPDFSDKEMDTLRGELEQELNQLTDKADQLSGYAK